MFILQYVSGALLSALFLYSLGYSFDAIMELSYELRYTWFIRDCHMLCANTVCGLLYLHSGKGFCLSRFTLIKTALYFLGALILLLTLGACFTGYVLVTGQMSYWALTVILNLLSVIPGVDESLLEGLLGGSHTTTWSLRRMFTLHWILASLAIVAALLHLVQVHRDTPSSLASGPPTSTSLLDILLKDGPILAGFYLLQIFTWLRFVIHPDNWQEHDPIRTPVHIEPEPYCLWLFCLLKSRPSKVVGVIVWSYVR